MLTLLSQAVSWRYGHSYSRFSLKPQNQKENLERVFRVSCVQNCLIFRGLTRAVSLVASLVIGQIIIYVFPQHCPIIMADMK